MYVADKMKHLNFKSVMQMVKHFTIKIINIARGESRLSSKASGRRLKIEILH